MKSTHCTCCNRPKNTNPATGRMFFTCSCRILIKEKQNCLNCKKCKKHCLRTKGCRYRPLGTPEQRAATFTITTDIYYQTNLNCPKCEWKYALNFDQQTVGEIQRLALKHAKAGCPLPKPSRQKKQR